MRRVTVEGIYVADTPKGTCRYVSLVDERGYTLNMFVTTEHAANVSWVHANKDIPKGAIAAVWFHQGIAEKLNLNLLRVCIDGLRDDYFVAHATYSRENSGELSVAIQPSDGIVLSMLNGSDLFVDGRVEGMLVGKD